MRKKLSLNTRALKFAGLVAGAYFLAMLIGTFAPMNWTPPSSSYLSADEYIEERCDVTRLGQVTDQDKQTDWYKNLPVHRSDCREAMALEYQSYNEYLADERLDYYVTAFFKVFYDLIVAALVFCSGYGFVVLLGKGRK